MNLAVIDGLADIPNEICLALRDCCAEAGYNDDLIMSMASLALSASGSEFLPLVHHVLTRRSDPAATLARLFAYSDSVDASIVRSVLGGEVTDVLLHTRVLAQDAAAGGAIRSLFQLRPLDGVWLLADDPAGGRDAVMPPAGTTRQMVLTMPPPPNGEGVDNHSVLDVGCGPGSLALVAALRGARRVLGTDVNERAVDMARFNARLNNLVPRTEFLVGDLVEPVRGMHFSLVLAQPPYVIQPPGAEVVTYLHGGPSGEELALRLLAALPEVLAPGGVALVLMEAAVHPNEALHARIRPLLGDYPADLLVLAAAGPPPSVQVLAYASLEAPGGGPAFRTAAHRYLDHLESLGAADFHHALVVLRVHPQNSNGRKRLAATVPVRALARGDAAALERLLTSIDLASLDDTSLGRRAVRASEHTRWIEERKRPDAALMGLRSVRFEVGSFGNDLSLSEERYAMSSVLDRAASVDAAVEAYALISEQPTEAARTEVLAFVREGLMRGIFEPG